jgi:predicted nuclease with TOPRIM domain
VSKPADNGEPQESFKTLEGVVGEALERLAAMTERAESAERKSAELNELMGRLTGRPEAAGEVLTRLKLLEEENADLRKRLERGRDGVEQMLKKIRFLEDRA